MDINQTKRRYAHNYSPPVKRGQDRMISGGKPKKKGKNSTEEKNKTTQGRV